MNETIAMRSLWCSAYLVLKGYELLSFDLVTPRDGNFIFEKSDDIEHDITDYYTANPLVAVRDYLAKYNELRDLVMRTRRAVPENGDVSK